MILTLSLRSRTIYRRSFKFHSFMTFCSSCAISVYFWRSWVTRDPILRFFKTSSRKFIRTFSGRIPLAIPNSTTSWTGQCPKNKIIIPNHYSLPRGMQLSWFSKVSSKFCSWTKRAVTRSEKGTSNQWEVWLKPWSNISLFKVSKILTLTRLKGLCSVKAWISFYLWLPISEADGLMKLHAESTITCLRSFFRLSGTIKV